MVLSAYQHTIQRTQFVVCMHLYNSFRLLHYVFYCDFVAVVDLQQEKCDGVAYVLPMRTCALAREFSVLEATAIEQSHDGGSFSLRETRFIGRWAV